MRAPSSPLDVKALAAEFCTADHTSNSTRNLAARLMSWADTPFAAFVVLALALVNTFYRLNNEFITEWDESLYATSAWEMVQSREWLITSFGGKTDYYNSKPPLNTWLIAMSFNAFGVSAFSLRLAAAASAWLTVVVLWWWTRHAIGPAVAAVAALVLSTTFGFLYVHSGRTANTDAPYALLLLLVVVTLWFAGHRPWRLLWLGPILSATFLLRGAAVLQPLLLIALVLVMRRSGASGRHLALPLAAAALLAALPPVLWAYARWQFDGWAFLGPMLTYDLMARSSDVLEGHQGSAWYYLWVLQRYQFDWLAAVLLACVLYARRLDAKTALRSLPHPSSLVVVVGAWVAVVVLVPTLMATKTTWYLNPFYPLFAMIVAWVVVRALSAAAEDGIGWRRRALLAALGVCVITAESRLAWRSWQERDWRHSPLQMLRTTTEPLQGRVVYQQRFNRAERFVLAAMRGAKPAPRGEWFQALADSQPGDYLLALASTGGDPRLELVAQSGGLLLCKRVAGR